MFPNISSGLSGLKSASSSSKIQQQSQQQHNTNKFKYVNYYVNSKTLWHDQYPPENIEKIYDDCTVQMQEIKRRLDDMCNEYGIDEAHLIRTLTAYSRHLTRLKAVVGLSEIKSAKTMSDVIKIVKNNIEYTRREQRKAAELLAKEQQHERELQEEENDVVVNGEEAPPTQPAPSPPKAATPTTTTTKPTVTETTTSRVDSSSKLAPKKSSRAEDEEVFSDDEDEDEEDIVMTTRKRDDDTTITMAASKLDLSNTISYLQHNRRPRTVYEPFDKLKRSDSIITPMLQKAKRERIAVSLETEEDLGYLQRLLEHTFKALKEYDVLIERVDKLCTIFEKYFLSFYDFVEFLLERNNESSMSNSHRDPYSSKNDKVSYEKLLEPVIKYNQKRREYMSFVQTALHNLHRLAETFDDDTHEGVSMRRHMSDDAAKLSRRCDCDYIQAALIIPEHNSQLNKCLEFLFQWLDYDRTYAECVRDELRMVEREKKRLSQMRNAAESSFNQLNHKIKLIKENMDSQVSEMKEMLKKANSKILEEYDEYSGTLSIVPAKKPPSTPIGPSGHQLQPSQTPHQMHQSLSTPVLATLQPPPITNSNLIVKYASLDCAKMLERVGLDLNEIDAELVRQSRVPINAKTKTSVVEEKFRFVVNARASLVKLSAQLFTMYQEKSMKQAEMDVWENSYVKLKEIYMCKVNSDTVEKIYYELEITSSASMSSKLAGGSADSPANFELDLSNTVFSSFSDSRKSDMFTNVFLIISNSIGSDWIKLYYSLSFYPLRGKETIKKDIDDVVSNLNRGNMQREQCFVSLQKWRRFNARSKVEDLRVALKSIGRADIVKEIDKSLARRKSDSKAKDLKKSSVQEMDARKREIEVLHQRLVKYLEKTKNGEESTQFDFKFATQQQQI